MSPVHIPTKLPFNLGGLVRPAETRPYGLTGVLPKSIPFTLSRVGSEPGVPYGSVGWELVCRSGRDFQTELVRTIDFTGITFSRELSAIGTASFSMNLSNPLFQTALLNGSSVEELFEYENLWEIRFDNKIRFQCLGTAVAESHLNENESRTATITAQGIGKVLDWANVYPRGFPGSIIDKLENLTDTFTGDGLNTKVWSRTGITSGITITNSGAKQEAGQEVIRLQAAKKAADDNVVQAGEQLNNEIDDYAAVFQKRDPPSTFEEKLAAAKALNAAKAAKVKAEKDAQIAAFELEQAVQRQLFADGSIYDDTSFGHLKLTVDSSGPIYDNTGLYDPSKINPGKVYAYTGAYDFEASGVSAGFDVAPMLSFISGKIETVFKISVEGSGSGTNYARMYFTKINNKFRMVAEVSNNASVINEDWEWDQPQMKFWRMTEDHGYVVFATSADNSVWTERFRSRYTWPSTRVNLHFGIELSGEVGIAPPLSAYMYKLNESAIPEVESAMANFRRLLKQAQSRGTISFVDTDFTDYVDSRGLGWIGKPNIDIAEGQKLSQALDTLTQVQQADWIMDNDFTLKVYQRTKDDSTVPPVYFTKDDVVFNEAGSQISKDRTRDRSNIANYIVGKNSAGAYAYVEDKESQNKFTKREAFIAAGNANDLENLGLVLDSSLQDLKQEKSSWRVTVAADQVGRRVFEDYDVGDWISIENIDTKNNISVGQWRVLAITVQITSDNITTVELTLQSRMDLLAQRLKAQVDSLSASSTSSGTTTLGSAISAATLLEQATLAGLRDVAITGADEGDVLTFSNGYWVPVAPGDRSIPKTPSILSVFSNVYYPNDAVSVKAQAEITWSLPTNEDGSVVTDGHHFEIRYRPDVSAYYPSTWLEASNYLWNQVYIWAQPTIPPITNSGWQTIYVGWDDLSTTIQELTPAVNYEIQIRAVDSSTPQHFSAWSEIFTFTAQRDSLAPPTPAPAVVASSMLGIQVTHYLGQAPNGQFNLPPDLAFLEVHVGGPAFYPDASTRVGKIVADAGMIRSGTPVIQSFPVEETSNIWVRVIAIDRAGNRSSPSSAVTSTINLIDDAHISNLTASKITAGTISSSIILGGVIKTAESGARAEMNFEGFRIFSKDDDATVSLLGNPGTNGNFLMIKDLEDTNATLAGIDGVGRGSFQDVSVNNDINIQGEQLLGDIIYPRAKGVISIGTYPGASFSGAGANTERGFMEISFIAEESRTYMICFVTEWESTVEGDRFVLRMRDAGEAEPNLAMPYIQQSIASCSAGPFANCGAQIIYSGTFTAGLHRILISFFCTTGNATINPPGGSGSPENTTLIWVEDVGLPKTDTVILNDAGIDELNAPPPTEASNNVSKPPKPRPKVEYTKTYTANWSGTYRSNGDYSSSHGATMVQGDSGADSYLNDARSMCGFNYSQIMADTKGATIKACYVTLYANHWYWNDGGTARIGTHNYTGRPSSWSGSRVNPQRISSSNWPKPGKRKVSLGVTIGNDFKSGEAKGITLGPTTGTKTQYGRFNGAGQSSAPVLTIVYVK